MDKYVNLYIISWYSNSYILEFDEYVILIDCGLARKASEIIKKLKEINKPLKYILITHTHIDHIFGLYEIYKNFPYSKIVAHYNAKDYLLGKKLRLPKGLMSVVVKLLVSIFGYKGFKPHIEVYEDEKLDEFISTIYTPGHTDDHICYVVDNKLFIGDLIKNNNGLSLIPKEFNEDENEIKNSIKKLLKVNFEEIYFGHGKPLLNNSKEILENFLNKL